jgi:iron complex outermembrane receptor protein
VAGNKHFLSCGFVVAALMWQSGAMAQQGQSAAPAADATPQAADAATAPQPATPAPADTTLGTLSLKEVVVTGSLIAGSPPVGVPVNTITAQDFLNTGGLNIAEAMKNNPAVVTFASLTPANNHADLTNVQPINIHGLGSLETLLLVDGMRVPGQAKDRVVSPDIINTIALEGVDVLADGASATYGSDAVAGVVNVRLLQNYNGEKTQVSYIDGQGYHQEQIGALAGRQWDGGGIVVSYEFENETPLPTSARPQLWTDNYTGIGGTNQTPVSSSLPATLTTGKVSYLNGVGGPCSNCYAVPGGLGPGAVVNFSQLTKGTENEVNPFDYGDILPEQKVNGITLAFHQDINDNLQFISENYFSDRTQVLNLTPGGNTGTNAVDNISATLPATGYPYLAPGYPTNLTVALNGANLIQNQDSIVGGETAYRIGGGFKFALPAQWKGTVQATYSDDDNVLDQQGLINQNNLEALLGNTVTASQPGIVGQKFTVTLPSNIPIYDAFCDTTKYSNCMSPAQLAFIDGFNDEVTNDTLRELNATFSGPIFSLPGGKVELAVGGDMYIERYTDAITSNNATASTLLPSTPSVGSGTYTSLARTVKSLFGQLNVPLVGADNAIPLVRSLMLQASGRYDRYSDFGGTSNPKIAFNWTPVEGYIFRGSWGTSFHAPPLANETTADEIVNGINGLNTTPLTTPNCPAGASQPVPGSAGAAILAATGGTCASEPYSEGVNVHIARPPGNVLGPETSKTWTIGGEIAPPQISGLDIDLTYYQVNINNVLGTEMSDSELNDPSLALLTGTVGSNNFASYVQQYLSLATSQVQDTAANEAAVDFIHYMGVLNLGKLKQNGLDFSVNYTLPDFGLGTWNVGDVGSYTFHQWYSASPGAPMVDISGTNTQGPESGDGSAQTPLRLVMRGHIGWAEAGYNANIFADYQSGFYNTAGGFPNHLSAVTTYDFSGGYNFGDKYKSGLLNGLSVNLEVTDLLNQAPPTVYEPNLRTTFDQYYFSPLLRSFDLTVSETW